ncbi:MAG: hypothetical protein MRY21_06205 [Simkaniaceae bacterium]|nr:hypothetical protein [Simkaniaceae bacterium]
MPRLAPYTRQSGEIALIPGSPCAIRLYPGLVIGINLENGQTLFKTALPRSAPPVKFLFMQEIENRRLRVEIDDLRFFITHTPEGIEFLGQTYSAPMPFRPVTIKRLSYGCHKAQEIERIHRRSDPKEYYPMLHALGSQLPEMESVEFNLSLHYFEGLFTPVITDRLHLGIQELNCSPLALLKSAANQIEKCALDVSSSGEFGDLRWSRKRGLSRGFTPS